jgi:hypothetical protein
MYLIGIRRNEQNTEKYRKYVCPCCGQVHYTVEFEAEQNTSFKDAWDSATEVDIIEDNNGGYYFEDLERKSIGII